MNFKYNYLGYDSSKYHSYIQPDSLFDISNYTDTMNVCGKTFNCDSLFQVLGLIDGIYDKPKKESANSYAFLFLSFTHLFQQKLLSGNIHGRRRTEGNPRLRILGAWRW